MLRFYEPTAPDSIAASVCTPENWELEPENVKWVRPPGYFLGSGSLIRMSTRHPPTDRTSKPSLPDPSRPVYAWSPGCNCCVLMSSRDFASGIARGGFWLAPVSQSPSSFSQDIAHLRQGSLMNGSFFPTRR